MTVLDHIVAAKREEVARLKHRFSASSFRDLPSFSMPRRAFPTALLGGPRPSVIAEIKKASPSAGVLNAIITAPGLSVRYRANGAAAISVLTDAPFFGGSAADLSGVRAAVDLPLLRKDFILDEIQVHESRAIGADAILLIASVLEPAQLLDLHLLATGLGLSCLVEVHHASELDGLDFSSVRLVGINNRDLRDLSIDLGTTARIAGLLPADVVSVSESGLRSAADVRTVAASGVAAVLMGEAFMRSGDPGESLGRLIRELRQN